MNWQTLRYWFGVTCGVLAGVLFLTDCFGGRTEHVHGQLEDKSYHAPYTTISCSTVNKVTTCHPVYHPAEYWLYVRSWEGLASVSTNAASYYTTHEGQAITYSRQRTRWSNYTWGNSY